MFTGLIIGLKLTLTCLALPSLETRVQVCWPGYCYDSDLNASFLVRKIKRCRGDLRSTLFLTGRVLLRFLIVLTDHGPAGCRNMYSMPDGMSLIVFESTVVLSSLY